ncbi:hypothetical protein WME75_38145 [Sorangium sp. So ce1014]|uniref:hypothetical protein n=1 Tax=Sorangium sp. So ce1014 TaxID=3133326 RepID=UPI003F5D5CEB
MRTARALVGRGMAAGAVALACAATARAEESTAAAPAHGAADAEEPAKPPRPPLPPASPPPRLPWDRHIEIGADAAFVSWLGTRDDAGRLTRVRLEPAIGLGIHARWEILELLRFSAFVVLSRHELALQQGALGQPGAITAEPREDGAPGVRALALGARLAPTLPLGERARAWASVGVGYDRFDFDRMRVSDPGGEFTIRERGASYVAIPLGLGVSLDLIRDWLTIELETSGAFVLGRGGDATREGQAIDGLGLRRTIGALPQARGSFIQTLGLSLVL